MLYLVRHGETSYNAEKRLQGQLDVPLNEKGVRQAEALGVWLKNRGMKFDALYTSRLSRAYETARMIGDTLGLEPAVIGGVEEIYFGCFQGHTFDECARLYPEAYADYLIHLAASNAHGGETGREVMERAREAILALPEAKDGAALVVCHGAVIGYLRGAVMGRDLTDIKDLIPKNARLVEFGEEALEKLRNYK